nr:DUF1906 domain-containing protein [Mycolicibacterium phlei]
MSIPRRAILKGALAAPAVLAVGTGVPALTAPAPASAAPLGVLLDYAAGVLRAGDIRAAGAIGAIRYVSDRRPGAEWMLGKPIQLDEARDLYRGGLKIVSCYQYGKKETADWLGGHAAGVAHAKRGWELHVAAGGSYGAPIYASIDDDPTYEQYKRQVAPYLRGWEAVLGRQRVGVYAPTPRPSNGRCRTASARTTGSTTGDRRAGSRTRPHICTRWRSTNARWPVSGWTSTTSSSPSSDSGTRLYRPVSSASKLLSVADTCQETISDQLSCW